MHYIRHQFHALWHHTTLWCQVHYICHHIHSIWPHVHCISVLTPTLSMISQPPYVWYQLQYTGDILCTIFMTSYTLCKTTQHGVLLIRHSAYVWHHLHYRWYHFQSITPNQCLWCHIYYRHDIIPTLLDIAPTVSLSSKPLHWYHNHFFFVVNFVIYWNETVMGLHVFPIPIPSPTSLSTCSP